MKHDADIPRYPAILSERGHDVLNIQRAGYGGNPIPTSKNPIIDSISVITDLITEVYRFQAGNRGGVIIFGHSLGAATTLAIAAQSEIPFPLLGVGALGCTPTNKKSGFLLNDDPANDELVVQKDFNKLFHVFGPIEYIDEDLLTADAILATSEQGIHLRSPTGQGHKLTRTQVLRQNFWNLKMVDGMIDW